MPRKILTVEDEQDIARMVQMTLRDEGYKVVTASTGREALEKVFFEKPDLIILDIMLPEIDGFEVLQHLRQNPATAQTPVIMLTAKSEERDVMKGWKLGADLYLTKPFDAMELTSIVERVFSGDTTALPPAPGARQL